MRPFIGYIDDISERDSVLFSRLSGFSSGNLVVAKQPGRDNSKIDYDIAVWRIRDRMVGFCDVGGVKPLDTDSSKWNVSEDIAGFRKLHEYLYNDPKASFDVGDICRVADDSPRAGDYPMLGTNPGDLVIITDLYPRDHEILSHYKVYNYHEEHNIISNGAYATNKDLVFVRKYLTSPLLMKVGDKAIVVRDISYDNDSIKPGDIVTVHETYCLPGFHSHHETQNYKGSRETINIHYLVVKLYPEGDDREGQFYASAKVNRDDIEIITIRE